MALAPFAVWSGDEARQMQVVRLDDLVPADDELRRIAALIDRERGRPRRSTSLPRWPARKTPHG
jgi:hypothetical protein